MNVQVFFLVSRFMHVQVLWRSHRMCDMLVCYEDEWCAPFKYGEVWVHRMIKQFGEERTSQFGAFQRVVDFLFSERGRCRTLSCLKEKIPLEGTSESNRGVEECYQICAELRKKREELAPPSGDSNASTTATDPPQPCSHAEVDETPGVSSTSIEGESLLPAESTEDPVMAEALSLATTDVARINVCTELPELCALLKARLFEAQKLIVLVDDATSRATVLSKHLDMLKKVLEPFAVGQRYVIIVNPGSRLDLLASVSEKLNVIFPKLSLPQSGHGAQKKC